MSWDTITEWIDGHIDQVVRVDLTAAEPDGNLSAVMDTVGPLGYSDGEWTLVDPAPGRQLACTVGAANFLILEGAVEDAEHDEPSLFIEFAGGNLTLTPAG